MRKPVELKFSNGFGLYDMHGSLLEWTGDLDGCTYPQSTTDSWCGMGVRRFFQGGYYYSSPDYMRPSYRNDSTPSNHGYSSGFRIGRHP